MSCFFSKFVRFNIFRTFVPNNYLLASGQNNENMKQLITIISILCLLFSCGKTDALKQEDLQEITLDFSETVIEIPRSYELISLNKLKEKLIALGKTNNITLDDILNIEKLKSISRSFIVYADTTNSENNIFFQEANYTELTGSSAQEYLDLLEKHTAHMWKNKKVSFEKIESEFISDEDCKIIKLKYKLTHDNFSRFGTQYIISSKLKTIGITVNSLTSEDYEALIRKLKMN